MSMMSGDLYMEIGTHNQPPYDVISELINIKFAYSLQSTFEGDNDDSYNILLD